MWNGLTYALDKPSGVAAATLINYMKTNHMNMLRLFVGWSNTLWSGSINDPINATTKGQISNILTLCAVNNFPVVFSVCCQVEPLKTTVDVQKGPNGEACFGGNYIDPIGPTFRAYTANLIQSYIDLARAAGITPWVSVDEIQYVGGGSYPAFYSESMKAAYLRDTGKACPVVSKSGTWTTEQQAFVDYCTDAIRTFYQMMYAACFEADPNCRFSALIDAYWVEGKYINESEPWDYYQTLNNACFEWFASQTTDLTEVRNRIETFKSRVPNNSMLYFIYGRVTNGVTLMRSAVQLALDEGFDGVFLYEWYDARNVAFDVSDITGEELPPPPPPPQCEPGFHWDETLQVCVEDIHICPSGYHWDSVVGACVEDTAQTYSLIIVASNIGGSTFPPAGTYPYPINEIAYVQAIPDAGYNFVEWIANGFPNTDNPIHLTMNQNWTVTPTFSLIIQHECPEGQHWNDAQAQCVPDTRCFIATACGTGNPSLSVLRLFRDKYMPPSLVWSYYLLSPPVAKLISGHIYVMTVGRRCWEWLACQLRKNLTF